MLLSAGALGALLSSSAFADDQVSTSASSKMRVQAQFELLPVGSGKGTLGGISMTTDTEVAYGISGAFDYALTPYLSLGVAPRLVFNVKSKDAASQDSADKELDLRARIHGHYPVASGIELFASLYPGYTIVMSSTDGVDSSTGFAIGGAVGLTYDVSPKLFVGGEVGYQRAFTSTTVSGGGQSVSADLDLSYMHIGLGAGTRF
jgi:opacity protein-like surface antigen